MVNTTHSGIIFIGFGIIAIVRNKKISETKKKWEWLPGSPVVPLKTYRISAIVGGIIMILFGAYLIYFDNFIRL